MNGQRNLDRVRGEKRRRLDPNTSRICIVGSGLAGLSTAISLSQAGFRRIQIFERDPSLDCQKEGYGLTLTYNPKGSLSELGVLETVAQHDCPSRSHYLFRQEEEETTSIDRSEEFRQSGAVPIGYFGNAFFDTQSCIRGYGQRSNLRIPRKLLRKILYEKLLHTLREQEQEQKRKQRKDNPGINNGNIVNNNNSVGVHWNHSLVDYKWDEGNNQYHLRFSVKNESPVSLELSDTIINATADLFIACDGIRSSVLQQLYNETKLKGTDFTEKNKISQPNIRDSPQLYGLHPIGVRLILGIANNIDHPLLRERGFYTVDTKGHRLFTMPYQSNRFDFSNDQSHNMNDSAKNSHSSRIMWQLSFSTKNNVVTSSLDSSSLREYVLKVFKNWHPPVLDLVRATPVGSIWGTDLMDRNPRQVYEDLIVGRTSRSTTSSSRGQSRLIICGDALHPMSPFKGQGANQALADGPLLSKMLLKSSINAAITNWWRETLNRTAPIVLSSRKAAKNWHDPMRIVQPSRDRLDRNSRGADEDYHGFAGVKPSLIPSLVKVLRKRSIGPHLGDKLDLKIRNVIQEYNWFDNNDNNANKDGGEESNIEKYTNICEHVLQLASIGDTERLRQASLSSLSGCRHQYQYCKAMVEAKDEKERTCLHLAALNDHRFTCHWLLVEMRVLKQRHQSCDNSGQNRNNSSSSSSSSSKNQNTLAKYHGLDIEGKTAYDYALQTGNNELIKIFQVVMHDEL